MPRSPDAPNPSASQVEDILFDASIGGSIPCALANRPAMALDNGAHDQEFSELRERLVRAVRKVCPADIAADAEDIVQTTLVRLLKARSAESTASVDPISEQYLRRAAYNGVIDEVRHRARQRAVTMASQDHAGNSEETQDSAPVATIAARQLGTAIEDCLLSSNPNRRAAVTLHLMGVEHGTIAGRMRWDARQVRNNLHRGMQALRDCLRGKGFSP
ncbi:MAG: RNA polymerase sigma factor [Nannocystaceae bacterium]|nr:RNA polymerase sigma factor [Nannocystaceae bacterium]